MGEFVLLLGDDVYCGYPFCHPQNVMVDGEGQSISCCQHLLDNVCVLSLSNTKQEYGMQNPIIIMWASVMIQCLGLTKHGTATALSLEYCLLVFIP